MDCSLPGSSVHGIFFRQEYLNGLPFPSPGNFPDQGIEPRSPALQVDSLTNEPAEVEVSKIFNLQLYFYFRVIFSTYLSIVFSTKGLLMSFQLEANSLTSKHIFIIHFISSFFILLLISLTSPPNISHNLVSNIATQLKTFFVVQAIWTIWAPLVAQVQCRRPVFNPGWGRSPVGGHGNPLQYSCLDNSWIEEPGGLVLGVAKSRTQLSD